MQKNVDLAAFEIRTLVIINLLPEHTIFTVKSIDIKTLYVDKNIDITIVNKMLNTMILVMVGHLSLVEMEKLR